MVTTCIGICSVLLGPLRVVYATDQISVHKAYIKLQVALVALVVPVGLLRK